MKKLAADGLIRLNLFRNLAKELSENYSDLNLSGIISCNFRHESGRIYAIPLPFSRHRFKGLLADYRLFHHFDPKKCLFFQTCELVASTLGESRLILTAKQRWTDPSVPIAGWHNEFSASDVLETALNTRFFHSDDKPKNSSFDKETLAASFEDNALIWGLFFLVKSRVGAILMVEREVSKVIDQGHSWPSKP